MALILVGGAVLLDMVSDRASKKLYCSVVAVNMALISGLRAYSVGPDTANYVWYFMRDATRSFSEIILSNTDLEKGYILFEYIVSRFTSNPTVFFLLVAFFFMAVTSLLVYRYSAEPCLSFLVFASLGFFTFSMLASRQTMALGITLLSFKFIKEKRLIPFLISIAVAMNFHFSSVAFLPAYFLARKKLTKTYIIGAAIGIPGAYLLKEQVFIILSKFTKYNYSPIENEGPYVLITLMILVFIGGFIQRESVIKRNADNLILYNMSFSSIIIAMLTFVHPSAIRVAYYYHIYLILFIPEIILSISDKKIRRIAYVLSIVALVTLGIRLLLKNSYYVPYLFFWQ